MSNPKFTPGPWSFSVLSRDRNKLGTLYAGDDDDQIDIADFCMDWVDEFKEEEIANARLIAKAPEMYEMLDNLARKLFDTKESKEIRALLAAARGEL